MTLKKYWDSRLLQPGRKFALLWDNGFSPASRRGLFYVLMHWIGRTGFSSRLLSL